MSWELHYPATNESELNRVRLHFTMFQLDEAVGEARLEMHPTDPFVRCLFVVFRPGYLQPVTSELRDMNLKLPARVNVNASYASIITPGFPDVRPDLRHLLQQVAAGLRVDIGMTRPLENDIFDFQYLAPPAPIQPTPVSFPPWFLGGIWARSTETGRCFHVHGHNGVGFVVGRWEDETSIESIWHEDFAARFEYVNGPRPTAWARLLGAATEIGEDDEK